MPRILYLWQGDYPWEVRVEKICRALAQHGCDVTILARWKKGQAREETSHGMRIVRVGYGLPRLVTQPVSFNPLWHLEISRLVHGWRPDLVIAREILLAENAALVARRRGIPTIIDMAEHYPATMLTFKKYQRNPLWRFLVFQARLPERVEARAVARADGIMTVCLEQNQRLHRVYGYPWKRMAVVENTPDLEVFAAVKKGPDIPARVFAYHGTMTPQRGLDNLVRGFALAAREHSDIQLLLAGGGESYDDLVSLAKTLNIADRVRFTGRYQYQDLVKLYGETDIGVVPQPADESCNHTIPNKLYDYLACGKPVIVSPAVPLQRVVEETHTGVALKNCEPETIAQSIVKIRGMDLGQLSRNALEAVRTKYHWRHDVQVMIDFLKEYL